MFDNATPTHALIAVLAALILIAASMFAPAVFSRIAELANAHRGKGDGRASRQTRASKIRAPFARQRKLSDYVPLYDFFNRYGPIEMEFKDDRGAKDKPHEWRMVLDREGLFARKRIDASLSRFEEYAVSWDHVRWIRVAAFPAHGMDIRFHGNGVHMRMDARKEDAAAFEAAKAQLELAASWAFLSPGGKPRARRGPFGRKLRNPYAWGVTPDMPSVPEAFSRARRFRAQSTAIDAPSEIPRGQRVLDEELDNETARIIRWENQEVRSL